MSWEVAAVAGFLLDSRCARQWRLWLNTHRACRKTRNPTLGMRFADDFHEMPDHIGVEFELMYRLLNAESEALEAGEKDIAANAQKAQRHILEKHIHVWVPLFCKGIKASTKDPYFRSMAVLTEDFLMHEKRSYSAAH